MTLMLRHTCDEIHTCSEERECLNETHDMPISQDYEYPLDSKWSYLWHHFDDEDFSDSSFLELFECVNIESFWRLYNNLPSFDKGMFFLMRNGMCPSWEESRNSHLWWFRRNNCSYEEANKIWLNLSLLVIGETLMNDNVFVNGIAISQKNESSYVFKILVNGDCGHLEFKDIECEDGVIVLQKDAIFLPNNQQKKKKILKKRNNFNNTSSDYEKNVTMSNEKRHNNDKKHTKLTRSTSTF